MKKTAFILSYIFTALFTYIWRPVLIAGSIADKNVANDDNVLTGVYAILIINYALLVLFAYLRGKGTDKSYLWALPLVGGFFDVVLAFIPFVPTGLNIATLVLGNNVKKG